ncbi:MAG TPA: multidrug effflux MFS transporter [Ilumatobacter sp.]|nr:multidrug effflux MFS transporter [Ilumatobacter sp.]
MLILGAVVLLGPLTVNLYLPALPEIETDLRTSAAAVQLTLTGTLLGLAVGQLVVGPLSDALGRRRPLIAGTLFHVATSLLCMVAPSIGVLGVLRVVQGFGASATAVAAMAIVRDLYTGRANALLLSRLMLVLGVAPMLAPSVGGAVLGWTSWRGVFGALALAGVAVTVLAIVALPETLPRSRRRSGSPGQIMSAYVLLSRDRTFVGLILVGSFSAASTWAYISGSSFVMQDQFGLSEQAFGAVFGAGAAFLVAGTQLSAWLLRRWTPVQILLRALAGATTASAVLLAVALADVGGLPALLVPLWVALGFAGTAMPNAPALALSRHGEAAGTAAALVGATRFGVGAAAAPFVGILGNDAAAMATVFVVGMSLAFASMLVVRRSASVDHELDVTTMDPTPGA